MSWLPFSLPGFGFGLPVPFLPTNIQHRLVSFAVRKALSSFTKTGSLNEDQINSQIGGGVVEITDLTLRDDVRQNCFVLYHI